MPVSYQEIGNVTIRTGSHLLSLTEIRSEKLRERAVFEPRGEESARFWTITSLFTAKAEIYEKASIVSTPAPVY
ncbi:MAG: hypothetical protein KME16_18000 [Scytolyngbya sp. HA4215-MV1]|nr:hypothetical protein [Scytolyngbya sp. HA4215-MV1]